METLEEAAERLQKDKYGIFISKDADVKGQLVIDTGKAAFSSGMNEGAKWQQKNSYSEEDMIGFAHFYFQKEWIATMQSAKSPDEILKEWLLIKKK